MKMRTNDKNVNMEWVTTQTSLIILEDYSDTECVTVYDLRDNVLFVCTFLCLKQLRQIKETAQRIANNYAQRRVSVDRQLLEQQLLEQRNLAAGGHPG